MQEPTVAVIWIDWYAYHLARFRALLDHCSARMRLVGIELVGGDGVHEGLNFRDRVRESLPVTTLLPNQGWHSAGQLRLAWETWRRLSSERPSAILVPGYYNLPAIAAAVWGKWNRSTTVLMTESTEQDHARQPWKEALKSWLIRMLFDAAIAGGEPHLRYLQKLGFPTHRIGRYYDVVDNDFFFRESVRCRRTYTREELSLPADYFLYVGRLSPEKNVDGLLRAFADYRRSGGEWKLVIVGDGPEKSALSALSEQLQVMDSVVWAGLKTTGDLAPYYAFASCFVLPSSREPWGLVVNEALASGLPSIVSSRCGCVADLIRNGENGIIFEPDTPGDLARALARICFASPEERQRMSARSLALIEQYSPRNWALEVERLITATAT
jgi:1,2-diacylglycerol 3-alpha-glucosyltransferase